MGAQSPDLLACGPISDVRIDLTTLCNLRCVYCPVSHDNYVGEHMKPAALAKATAAIKQLCRHNPVGGISINGHGETTYMPGWTDICAALFEEGARLNLISNLAKAYTPHEFETLARLDTITISVDTTDRALLKRVRRKVDLRHIISNIQQTRAAARRLKVKPPKLRLSCGMYDKSAPLVEDLAWLAVSLDVARVIFWNLIDYTYLGTDVPEEDRVYALSGLPAPQLRECLTAIDAAIAVLEQHAIEVEIVGDFLPGLRARLQEQEAA